MQSECEYRDPAPPRRRKKRPPEEDLLDRCKRYEDMLRSYGATIDAPLAGDENSQISRASQGGSSSFGRNDLADESAFESRHAAEPSGRLGCPEGKLIVNQGKSRFVEGHLWNTFSEAFRDPNEILIDSASSDDEEYEELRQRPSELEQFNEEDLFFGLAPGVRDISSLHPDPRTVRRLWTIFIENINPIIKVIHGPSVEALIFEGLKDLKGISKSLEALLFSIYAAAITSIDAEQCKRDFGQDKKHYLAKFLSVGRIALANSRFLRTSDIMVLQAFVLYLVASQPLFDPRSAWTVTGIAVRIGQRIGLDRDGAEYGLGPFEVEMRRRLWFQITWMDARSGQLSGAPVTPFQPIWDAKSPLNVNDVDLYPGMETEPSERQGATEMMFCLLRFEMTRVFRDIKAKWSQHHSRNSANKSLLAPEEKEQLINQLEASIEEKFLRYCDPLVPLHLMSTIIARSALCLLRILAHDPRHLGEKTMSEAEKDTLFANSLKALEYDNLAQLTASTRQFRWHTHSYFQWPAMLFLLNSLRTKTLGEEVDRAWRQVEDVFRNHPDVILSNNNALHIACGNLALKAWEARTAAFPPLQAPPPPLYIVQLYARREKAARKAASKDSGSTPSDRSMQIDSVPHQKLQPSWSTPEDLSNFAHEFTFTQSPVDWNEWDSILQGFQVPDFSAQKRIYSYS